MAATRARRHRTYAINRPSPAVTVFSYALLVAWAVVVLFPLYWLAVTSLKTPLDVNGGPFYFPFRDFKPTLESWRYIFVDLGEDTFRPYLNTVVAVGGCVGLGVVVVSLGLRFALGVVARYETERKQTYIFYIRYQYIDKD